jgi:hypothetical protein
MKKLSENKWLDHIFKTLIGMGIAFVIYLLIDIRDVTKYIQPAIDSKQNEQLKHISDKQIEYCEIYNEKNAVVHKRIDKCVDDIDEHNEKLNNINRKLDLVLYKLDLRISDETTLNTR